MPWRSQHGDLFPTGLTNTTRNEAVSANAVNAVHYRVRGMQDKTALERVFQHVAADVSMRVFGSGGPSSFVTTPLLLARLRPIDPVTSL